MKKIPTLFKREFEGHKAVKILPEVTTGMEWVLEGKGLATVKWDGACCMIKGEKLYKRYDAKRGKTPPVGAIPCCEPDPTTGHWPHWVEVDRNNPADKWFLSAFSQTLYTTEEWTFEAVGPHFQGNPYGLERDILIPHGKTIIEDLDRSFEGVKEYLRIHNVEGIVFWDDFGPRCKIKRSDFGFRWPMKNE